MRDFVLMSEAVTAAHPDKLSDQISDAIVDACLTSSPAVGCVAECALASGVVFLSVRHGAPLTFDPANVARRVLAEEGYAQPEGEAPTTVILDLVETPELVGPIEAADAVATRMTTAFGFACDQTPERMPLPVICARDICLELERTAKAGFSFWLAPDAQAQVAVRFANRKPMDITGIALGIFTSNEEAAGEGELAAKLRAGLVDPVMAARDLEPAKDMRFSVHQVAGAGGPKAHAGLTGRKTASDFYGGYARQSGSALSGKDPSRIDRIAAYAARQAAVSVVAAGLARECEVQLSYVPGERGPASIEIDCFDTAVKSEPEISALLAEKCDFRVGAIVEQLGLWTLPLSSGDGFYRALSRYGHFGRGDMGLPWDKPVAL
ncbi:methionine adenosyltransferase domain-containing protein [uncultured Roseibium sp.]|uniref:methionine adenosyltransferase domain-containing protein n=1 Tax=uncultured Roseibium sp. TaxID=1936171 RepID=UPI003216FAC2